MKTAMDIPDKEGQKRLVIVGGGFGGFGQGGADFSGFGGFDDIFGSFFGGGFGGGGAGNPCGCLCPAGGRNRHGVAGIPRQ